MVPSAHPDLWSDLSELGRHDADGTDARAALLKVNAEMFVAAPARDRESIETFEALALGFLPKADRASLLDIARILAPCEDTPASVLDFLSHHSPEARGIVLRHAAGSAEASNARLLASPEGRLRLAARPGLDSSLAERLLVLGEAETEHALAAHPDLASIAPARAVLVERARNNPALAQILLRRGDMSAADEACLYLSADRACRQRIRERVAAAVSQHRATLSFVLEQHDVGQLLAAARAGDMKRFERLLTDVFEFPAATEWRALRIGRHRLLALALKALNLPERDALRILLALHPALSHPLSAIRDLVREMRDVTSPVALALVEAILGAKARSGRDGL